MLALLALSATVAVAVAVGRGSRLERGASRGSNCAHVGRFRRLIRGKYASADFEFIDLVASCSGSLTDIVC